MSKSKTTNKSNTHITAYWEGYTEQGCSFPLNEVPTNVNFIPIAFIQPVKDPLSKSDLATTWAFDDQFVYTKEEIHRWINEINARDTNQKVLLSIMDTPTCHWYPDVDIDSFAKNIAKSCDEWNLGGIDVDAESGMSDPSTEYVKTFVNLIKSLRKYLSEDKIISYTCYTESSYDTDIIQECKSDIDYINTMAYWNNTSGQISLYKHYVNDIGDCNKVGIGVKAGNGGDSTTLQTVEECAQYFRDNDQITEKRMMLWSLTRDVKEITQVDDNTFLNTIAKNIAQNTNNNTNNNNNKNNFNNVMMKQEIFERIISFMEENTAKDDNNSDDAKVAEICPNTGFGDILGSIDYDDEWSYIDNNDTKQFVHSVKTNKYSESCTIL